MALMNRKKVEYDNEIYRERERYARLYISIIICTLLILRAVYKKNKKEMVSSRFVENTPSPSPSHPQVYESF